MFFTARVENWKFLSTNIWEYVRSLKDWEYCVEIKKATRTQQQNKLYWSILEQIHKETWNDKDELHNFFKHTFLKKPILTALWEYDFIPTTTELDKEEFTNYVDNIILFCQQQWLTILTD